MRRKYGGRSDGPGALFTTLRRLIWHPEDFSGVAAVAKTAGLSVRQLERRMHDAGFVPMMEFRRTLLAMHAATLLEDGYTMGEAAEELRYGSRDGFQATRTRALREHMRAVTGLTPIDINWFGPLFYPYDVHAALRRSELDGAGANYYSSGGWTKERIDPRNGVERPRPWPFWARDIAPYRRRKAEQELAAA